MGNVSEDTLATFLNEFRPNPQGWTPDALEKRTGIAPAVLAEARRRVEKDGFVFDDDDEGRWRLADMPDCLYPYWIRAGLRCDRLGTQIYYQDEVESTQDVAFELMVEGRPPGTLVLAEHQTGGRGRGDRAWFSTPRKSLLFSLLLDLEPPGTFASVLTIAIATAVARAVQDVAGVPARIKFPNDITVRGKKVAGILLEVRDYGVPNRVVAGVGINVNQSADELPEPVQDIATSLREASRDQRPIRRSRLLKYILRELEKWLEHIGNGEYDDLENAWNRFSAMEDKEVEFKCGGDEVSGRILDASIVKGLLVRGPDGAEQRYRLEHLTDVRFL